MKLAKYLEYILLGLSAILVVLFFVMPHSTTSDSMVDTYLFWTYALLFATIIILLAFLLVKTFSSKKGIKTFLFLLIAIVALLAVSFLLAKGGDVQTSVAYTPQTSKLVDTILNLTYILIGGVIVALVGSGIRNAIKNR